MMPRYLVVLVVGVVVLAIGAVAVLATLGKGGARDASPGASVSEEFDRSAEAGQSVGRSKQASPDPGRAETTESAPRAATLEVANPEEATPPAEAADPSAWAVAYLDTLSEDRQEALQKELWRRQMKKAQEQFKYQMPTDMRLYGLEWHNRGANKLDDSQKSRIRQLAESFRPRLDAALQTMWAEDAALNEQMATAGRDGRHEEIRALVERRQQIMQQISAAKADLDKEYRESVRSILTPEQAEYLDTTQGQVIQSWGGQRVQ
jgi:Spy/CpxP family protein refolding chaperone